MNNEQLAIVLALSAYALPIIYLLTLSSRVYRCLKTLEAILAELRRR